MKHDFLTENRRLLQLCAGAARFCGLLGLGVAGVLAALMVVLVISGGMGPDVVENVRSQLLTRLAMIAFYGFVALVLAEFISFLLASEGEPKWILRHGDKIIYAYVVYFIVVSIYTGLQTPNTESSPEIDFHRVITLALLAASVAVKVLIWIGIGIVLRKVVPIIRESKTLV